MAKRGRKSAAKLAVAQATGPGPEWDPPELLSEDQAALYQAVVDRLDRAGSLQRTDPLLVEAYAINADLLRQAQAALLRDGHTLVSDKGRVYAHPMLAVVNSASMRLKTIISDLGLCPAANTTNAGAFQAGGDEARDEKWGDLLALG